MSEIFNIIIQILFSLLILSFPINLIENNKNSKFFLFSLIDKLSLNLIFFANYLLLASFFNININYIYVSYFVLTIILYSLYFNNNDSVTIENNHTFTIDGSFTWSGDLFIDDLFTAAVADVISQVPVLLTSEDETLQDVTNISLSITDDISGTEIDRLDSTNFTDYTNSEDNLNLYNIHIYLIIL